MNVEGERRIPEKIYINQTDLVKLYKKSAFDPLSKQKPLSNISFLLKKIPVFLYLQPSLNDINYQEKNKKTSNNMSIPGFSTFI